MSTCEPVYRCIRPSCGIELPAGIAAHELRAVGGTIEPSCPKCHAAMRNMRDHRRAAAAAADSLALSFRRLEEEEEPRWPLYWAFIAGQQCGGLRYAEARRTAAALGFVPFGLPIDDDGALASPLSDYARRVAQASMVSARDMFDARLHNAALYWAFVGGMMAADKDYAAAKREAAAFGLAPAHEQL